jgi:sarcosine oxidase / L-pipecolate oxidase
MTFACDGKPGRMFDIWQGGLDNVRRQHSAKSIVEMSSAEQVFRRIHGVDTDLVPDDRLGRERKWVMGYTNLEDAFIDAEASVQVYYERCLSRKNIDFVCGTPVKSIIKDSQSQTATGVLLEDGRQLKAKLVLLAAGAWSNTLVNMEQLAYSSAIEVAWIPLTLDECNKWKNMSITTNLSTGFNLFPPYKGEMKCLRRSPGYCNTVTIPNPDNPEGGRNITVSVPRTLVTNPTDVIPQDAENALRDNLKELMPSLADRKFDRTKLCW